MDWIKTKGMWLWNNFDRVALLGGWAVSAGILPYLLSFNQGVTPVGYGLAAVIGILSFAAFRAMWARAALWKIDAKLRERLTGDGSNFDPMARVYEGKRIYLRDLAPVGRRKVVDKRFINCELIGPGTAIIGLRSGEHRPWPTMKECHTFDVDCVEMDPERLSNLAVTLLDCDFDGCHFYHLTLLFFRRENDTLNWITPNFDQPRLIEDTSVGNQQG